MSLSLSLHKGSIAVWECSRPQALAVQWSVSSQKVGQLQSFTSRVSNMVQQVERAKAVVMLGKLRRTKKESGGETDDAVKVADGCQDIL